MGTLTVRPFEDYTVIDIETTGLRSSTDGITELSALRVRDGEAVDEFSTLVHPGMHIPSFITDLTGISDAMVRGKPRIGEVLPAYIAFLGDDVILGHNTAFDLRFIEDRCKRAGIDFSPMYTDTMKIGRAMYPEMEHHRLSDLAYRFDVSYRGAHRALTDCRITAACYEAMKADAIRLGLDIAALRVSGIKPKYIKAADIVPDSTKADPACALYGKICVFTGFEGEKRREYMQLAADKGAMLADRVTRKTHILIAADGAGTSANLDKARDYEKRFGAPQIIGEREFISVMGGRA